MTPAPHLPPRGGRSHLAPPPTTDREPVGGWPLTAPYALASGPFTPPTTGWEMVGNEAPGHLPPNSHPLGWEVGGAQW